MRTIVYVDEVQDDIEHFEDYFEKYSSEIKVISIEPKGKSITEVVDDIFKTKCSLVAIDYDLKYSDKSNTFNGDELFSRIKDRKPYLPLLIFTSLAEEAKEKGFLPPNTIIKTKREISNLNSLDFRDEVIKNINFYEEQINKYKSEFAELRKKQMTDEGIKGEEKRRIIELNLIIEEFGDRQLAVIPVDDEEFERVNKLMSVTQELLSKLNQKEDDI